MTKLKTVESLQQQLHEKYPNIDIISEYTGANQKVLLKCNKCGHVWETTARSAIHSRCGCPICGVAEAKRLRAKKLFLSRLSDQYTLIQYNSFKDVVVKCNVCGKIRHTTSSNILRFGCKTCSLQPFIQQQTKDQDSFIKESIQVHGNKYDYSKVQYINCKTKVCIICPEHGEFWQTPSKHLCGQGCPKCIGKNATKEEFIQKAKCIFGDFYDYSKIHFVNMTTPIELVCPIHGSFTITPTTHIQRCGCKQCSESSGEKLINSILVKLHIPFIREFYIVNPFCEGRRFRVDFYIEYNNKKYIIEYNGTQHYRSIEHFSGELQFNIQKLRDQQLRDYCKENNVKLLEIKYSDTNIEKQIKTFLNVPSI